MTLWPTQILQVCVTTLKHGWHSDSLWAGQSGDWIPVCVCVCVVCVCGVIFSAHIWTGPGAHPASYTMGTRVFLGGKAARASCWPPTPIQRQGWRMSRAEVIFTNERLLHKILWRTPLLNFIMLTLGWPPDRLTMGLSPYSPDAPRPYRRAFCTLHSLIGALLHYWSSRWLPDLKS